MSSDESAWEGEGADRRRVYYVRKRMWRSSEVNSRLEVVDANMNRTNAFGRARPGNAPRHRIRSGTASESARAPVVSCPKNFYSVEFVSGLSNLQHHALKMESPMNLGYVHLR
jgi:hypothetical protein